MTLEDEAIVVDLALRLDTPRRERNMARLLVAALIALAIDLTAAGLVWLERSGAPAPAVEDIPIEVVVEPPQPTPSPPPSPQAGLQEPEDTKPATDAPRAGKSDHDDEHVAEQEKPAAAPPPPAAAPSPEPSKAAAPPAAPEAPQAADAPAPQETATPETQANAPSEVLPPSMFASVPDIDFGGAAIKSPVTGGNARSNYKTQLYGLIVPRMRVPAAAHTYGRTLTGAVSFTVDGGGHLMQRFVTVTSGSMELDEAAMQAVGAASRLFPPPPRGAPMGLVFTYSAN